MRNDTSYVSAKSISKKRYVHCTNLLGENGTTAGETSRGETFINLYIPDAQKWERKRESISIIAGSSSYVNKQHADKTNNTGNVAPATHSHRPSATQLQRQCGHRSLVVQGRR